ncbi:putative hydroxyisocaproate protein [Neofusicoccum parvum UCRNP2]|uniref:Putative hydroxyisocaproate protein n=1 Tax=Botryosphaeria parva (strain UCR-NP2) TaxID=1287680 RepID=R1EPF5_BOTPV|nr:putative hydroxyisocaproate protein [Neofusicoccum parvum UCRNP2]
MSSGKQALLIGDITHARKEWEGCSSFVGLQEFPTGTREEFLANLKSAKYDNVVVIYRSNDSTKYTGPFDKELVQALPSSLKYICHNGAGYDNIDVVACSAKGISVANTPQAVDDATADVALFLLLGALRRITIPFTAVRQNQWRGSGFGLGHDPRQKTLGNAKYVSFDELLSTSDVISLNLGLSAATRHIIGPKEFAKMKDGVVIVNTARGPVMDEAALVDALASGKVWSAGLDVFEEEPKIHPGLLKNENVVLLPHIGTATFETQRDMELLVLENLRLAVQEGTLKTQVPEQRK